MSISSQLTSSNVNNNTLSNPTPGARPRKRNREYSEGRSHRDGHGRGRSESGDMGDHHSHSYQQRPGHRQHSGSAAKVRRRSNSRVLDDTATRSTSRPSTTSPNTIPGGVDHVQNTSPEAMDEDEDEEGSAAGDHRGGDAHSPAGSERGDMDVESDDVDADADVVSRGLVSDEDARALYAL